MIGQGINYGIHLGEYLPVIASYLTVQSMGTSQCPRSLLISIHESHNSNCGIGDCHWQVRAACDRAAPENRQTYGIVGRAHESILASATARDRMLDLPGP